MTHSKPSLVSAKPPPPVLTVSDLHVRLHTATASTTVVDGVSYEIDAGQTVALVGESGCGKTVSALSLIRLLPPGVSIDTSGSAILNGTDLLALSEAELTHLRGRDVGVIFQDPLSAFNPARRVGPQLAEPIRRHKHATKRQAQHRVFELLSLVGMSEPRRRYDLYPHELSGGMRQRALIAMAIAAEPSLVIADEPTTALDASVQAQVLELLQHVQQQTHTAMLLITHDLGVVAGIADRVLIMYAGRVAEEGSAEAVLNHADHPYTQGLLDAVPKAGTSRAERFRALPGNPPDFSAPIPGCAFEPRCRHAQAQCRQKPPLENVRSIEEREHRSACWVHPGDRASSRHSDAGSRSTPKQQEAWTP